MKLALSGEPEILLILAAYLVVHFLFHQVFDEPLLEVGDLAGIVGRDLAAKVLAQSGQNAVDFLRVRQTVKHVLHVGLFGQNTVGTGEKRHDQNAYFK